ncbi:uncharacterized protein METZ01_LOCUS195781, partial [marine metagenome]
MWEGRKLIILVTSVITVCTMLIALSLTNYYISQATMSIMTTEERPGFSGVGGLASFAGINISTENTKGAMIVNTIYSRAFLKKILSYDDVLPSIMAAESYDSESKKLVFDSDIYDATNKKWLRPKPSHIEAYSSYRDIVTIDFHDVRNTIFLDAEHISPIFAQELLALIIQEADNTIRQKDLTRSSEAITYLTAELENTLLTEIKMSINYLLQ